MPVICIDFDGVLNSFKSGWRGARYIPDPPVEGAIEWIRNLLAFTDNEGNGSMYPKFRIAIYSGRSRFILGRRAMKKWLMKYGLSRREIRLIVFPLMKPVDLYVQIDDRAITFTGIFPTVEEIKNFKPWHKK